MIRRNPTRIELRMDDITEYNKLKAEKEAKRKSKKQAADKIEK